MSIYKLITAFLLIAFTILSTQAIGQRYSKVTQGNDREATEEQVFDDISTMEQVVSFYKIEETKLQSNLENYSFWVSFINENRMSRKRKKLIRDFLGKMKRELAQ